jgi:hypothetical protein
MCRDYHLLARPAMSDIAHHTVASLEIRNVRSDSGDDT